MAVENILIIDDDPVSCFILQKLLPKDVISNVKTFYGAKEGMRFILKDDYVDNNFLIFLDLNMPEMSGWDFLEILKTTECNCDIKIVIVTSSIDPEDQRRALTYSNVIKVLDKPIKRQELLKMIDAFESQKIS